MYGEKYFKRDGIIYAGAVNTADITTRVCKESDFQLWFHGPEMLHSRNSEVEDLNAEESLKQVERLVGDETKVVGGRKGDVGKLKNDLVIRVVNAVVVEHVEFEKVECHHRSENNIHKIIEIARYSSFEKLIVLTWYVLQFMRNNSNKEGTPNYKNADEHNFVSKLWKNNKQSLIKIETKI